MGIGMTTLLRAYLKVLAGLTLISGVGQLTLPARIGAASAWGTALGWQREIGFWGLAMYVLIATTLRANDPVAGRSVALALVTLQFLVAANHIAAAIQGHAVLNEAMGAVNFACVVLGIFALRSQRALSAIERR